MLGISSLCTTHSRSTLQKEATFMRMLSSRWRSVRRTRISGWIPIPCNSFTECCVGFVFNSSAAFKYGTYVRCTHTALRPSSHRNCRIASMKGALSISPMVPPTSVITKSKASPDPSKGRGESKPFLPPSGGLRGARSILLLISSVI